MFDIPWLQVIEDSHFKSIYHLVDIRDHFGQAYIIMGSRLSIDFMYCLNENSPRNGKLCSENTRLSFHGHIPSLNFNDEFGMLLVPFTEGGGAGGAQLG